MFIKVNAFPNFNKFILLSSKSLFKKGFIESKTHVSLKLGKFKDISTIYKITFDNTHKFLRLLGAAPISSNALKKFLDESKIGCLFIDKCRYILEDSEKVYLILATVDNLKIIRDSLLRS